MKPTTCATLTVAAAALVSSVHGHGQMMVPTYRPVTDWYRESSGALTNAGDSELQWAPVENLASRKQADFPEADDFSIMNGCRGMKYEESNEVTTIAPGADFELQWYVQAPHPGWMALSIVKPSTASSGLITYEQYMNVTLIDPFAESGGTFTQTVTMPSDVEGCDAAGDCALQFYWHSDVANQTYPTCADIIVSGSGSSTSTTTTPTTTTATPTTTTAAPATTTAAPATSTASSSESSVDGEADDANSEEAETPTTTTAAPATTTEAPATTTATPTATTACRRRMRN